MINNFISLHILEQLLLNSVGAGLQAVEVNGCINGLQVFAVVGFGIEFKEPDQELRSVLQFHFKRHCLINFELSLIRFLESNDDLILDGLELVRSQLIFKAHDALIGEIDFNFHLYLLQSILIEFILILLK